MRLPEIFFTCDPVTGTFARGLANFGMNNIDAISGLYRNSKFDYHLFAWPYRWVDCISEILRIKLK